MLRPFDPSDAPGVQLLAGAHEVADTTLTIPHPYPDGAAETWIAGHQPAWEAGNEVTFAITDHSGELLGAIGLGISAEQGWAELGYWIGVPYWSNGYCTEAGRLVVKFAFEDLHLHRVQSRHFTRNPQSGRVMQKLGMQQEGLHRGAIRKDDRFEDVVSYAILATDID